MVLLNVGAGYFGLFYISLVCISLIFSFIELLKLRKERKKENVAERNHTKHQAPLDVHDKKDREFMEFIADVEVATNKFFIEFFDNIDNLEYIEKHSSSVLFERIKTFVEQNANEDKHLVIKGTVVNHNEIETKKNNLFTTTLIIECFNYIEDSKGNYLCGYKVNKEFVMKRVVYRLVNNSYIVEDISNV